MKTYKLTQTETHTYKAESEAELIELFNEGVLDCADTITVTVEEITADFSEPTPQLETRTFTFLSGETYDVEASNLQEAQTRLDDYLNGESFEYVEEGETLSEAIVKPCLECPKDAKGWHKHDDAGITYEGLKQAQNEAIIQGIQYAIDYLEDINYHDGANAVAEFLDLLTENTFVPIPEWQREFFAKHSFYSTECEGSN